MAKTAITSIGTSVFDHSKVAANRRDTIRGRFYNERELFHRDVDSLIKSVTDELLRDKGDYDNDDVLNETSAEIKSLYKIYKKFNKEDLTVYLLATYTLEGYAAGQIIKNYIERYFPDWNVIFGDNAIIKGLQVRDAECFQRRGVSNLIKTISDICSGYYEDKILNITGGYKVVIPFLAILGQVWGIPIYYTFEDEQNLIEIPRIPLEIDMSLFAKYSSMFERLEEIVSIEEWNELKQEVAHEDKNAIDSLIYTADDIVSISPIGEIFWNRYTESFAVLFLTSKSKNFLDKHISEPPVKSLIDKLVVPAIRKNHLHDLNNVPHDVRCFKEPNTPYRVLYKERNGKLMVYGIYTSHDDYEHDIAALKFNDDEVNIRYEYKK